MDTAIVVLIFVVSIAIATNIVLVRRRLAVEARRAADESKELHRVLARMTEQLASLVTTDEALRILQGAGFLVARNMRGEAIFVSDAAAKLMNSTPAELLGSTYQTLRNTQEGTRTLAQFVDLVQLSGKAYPDIEINYESPSGNKMRLLCSVSPMRDLETGDIVGTVTILTVIHNYRSRW